MRKPERERADMQLSICMIARNEEKNIARCLQRLLPYHFEIVVVDTGSEDKTKRIAREYTKQVYDFAWCDDFAAAKNFAISKAANPYLMFLDCDEFLEAIDMERLIRLIQSHPDGVGRIQRRNVFTRRGQRQENREWLNRIFARDRFHYAGRIHEQIVAIDGEEYATWKAPVEIEHTGYDLPKEERRKKAERNITLLQRELRRLEAEVAGGAAGLVNQAPFPKKPLADGQLPYLLYQLGKSYYMAEDYAAACDYFAGGLSYDLDPKLEYVIDMVETYGYALLNSGQAEKALFFENIYEEFGGSADFQFLMGLIYMNNARFEEAVQEFLKAVQHRACRNRGVNSYAAYYNIGVIYECTGKPELAREYYGKCGDYEPAVKRLRLSGQR